ncbi:MAG: hypothetical protein B9S34_02545 [Opitutia bacterium Tous-C1TDCM]|nr:MAG: hypothetical protein B9S34_02545 [Opitutae bacterium Tous-C1TDCM]
MKTKHVFSAAAFGLGLVFAAPAPAARAASGEVREAVQARVAAEFASLEAIYKQLHANPELAFQEFETAALLAKELRALGIEVTEKVGNTGVVGVLKNGDGPTVLLRADMDGLPVKELVDLPWASKAVKKDLAGKEVPTMHACGHDLHVTGLIGAARTLVALKERWRGTIVFVGQPAEEIVSGARAMLTDGLYTRFPRPDFALGLHVFSHFPAGLVGYTEGPAYASSWAVDVVVRGVGGHGSAPHTTKDPVVLAAQIVLGLQTIVSREIQPGVPAVVTVGSIHGGTKRNIIGEEVKLELTLRGYEDKVMEHLVASIRRMCDGLGRAAGVPEDRLPVVVLQKEGANVTVNTPELTRKLAGTFREWFGAGRVEPVPPITGAEDFSEYGRTVHRVPAVIWTVGAGDPAAIAAAKQAGKSVPTNHSPDVRFLHDPTLQTCVISLAAAALELMPARGVER